MDMRPARKSGGERPHVLAPLHQIPAADTTDSSSEEEDVIPAQATPRKLSNTGTHGPTLRPSRIVIALPTRRSRPEDVGSISAGSKRQKIQDGRTGTEIRSRRPSSDRTAYLSPESSLRRPSTSAGGNGDPDTVDADLLSKINATMIRPSSHSELNTTSNQLTADQTRHRLDDENGDSVSDLDIRENGNEWPAIEEPGHSEKRLGCKASNTEEIMHADEQAEKEAAEEQLLRDQLENNHADEGNAEDDIEEGFEEDIEEDSMDEQGEGEPQPRAVSEDENVETRSSYATATPRTARAGSEELGTRIPAPQIDMWAVPDSPPSKFPVRRKPQPEKQGTSARNRDKVSEPDSRPKPRRQLGTAGWTNSAAAIESVEYSLGDDDSSSPESDYLDASPRSRNQLFDQDVQKFRGRLIKYEEDSAYFDAPPDEVSSTIRLCPLEMDKVHRLMGRRGWNGGRRRWEANLGDVTPNTSVGMKVIQHLVKLERFLIMTPKAPRILEQTRFLSEHKDLSAHYFSKMDDLVNRIRTHWLPFPKPTSSAMFDEGKRRDTAQDLIRYVIPMLVRVLKKAWKLGGPDDDTAFTSSTVQLLSKGTGWIIKLYGSLSRELQRRPLDARPAAEYKRKQWQQEVDARDGLKAPLRRLRDALAQAPDQLEKEEVFREKLKELEALQKIKYQHEDEGRLKAIEAHNRRVKMSLERRKASNSQPPMPSSPITRQPLSLETAPSDSVWRQEEERCLWGIVSKSLHQLPDLHHTARMVGHEPSQTSRKTEELLREIVNLTHNDEASESDKEAYIEETMRPWR